MADRDRFQRTFLLLLLVTISLVFFLLVRSFVITVMLAAIFSSMATPLYRRILRRFRGRQTPASVSTILLILLIVVIPASGFVGIVTSQAVQVSQSVRPWVERQLEEPDQLDRLMAVIPFADKLEPYRGRITTKLGELASSAGTFVVTSAAAMTRGTVTFLLHLFILLYAMFFFLIDGQSMLNRILYLMPLGPKDERKMVDRFVSVTRATLKGTLVIGIIQGGLAGIAFAIAGIGGSAFWGTVMAVLSVIPGVGAALVWIPAVIYLFATGSILAGILLFVWCALLVGSVDNVLRPKLIGKDTKMSDLMILISTLGGIALFGAIGFVLGPIVAALFVTVWDIYGEAFKEYLPEINIIESRP